MSKLFGTAILFCTPALYAAISDADFAKVTQLIQQGKSARAKAEISILLDDNPNDPQAPRLRKTLASEWIALVNDARGAFEVDIGRFPLSLEDLLHQPNENAVNWHGPYLDEHNVALPKLLFGDEHQNEPTLEEARQAFQPLAEIFPKDPELDRILKSLEIPETFQKLLAEAKNKAKRIQCQNNLKQIGLAFFMWAGDHNEKFPFQVTKEDGGTRELRKSGGDGLDDSSFIHFQVLSNELGAPKILVCPLDPNPA